MHGTLLYQTTASTFHYYKKHPQIRKTTSRLRHIAVTFCHSSYPRVWKVVKRYRKRERQVDCNEGKREMRIYVRTFSWHDAVQQPYCKQHLLHFPLWQDSLIQDNNNILKSVQVANGNTRKLNIKTSPSGALYGIHTTLDGPRESLTI